MRFLSANDGFVDFAMFFRPCGALVCFCSILIVFLVILSFLCDCVGFFVLHDGRKKRWKPSKLRPNQCRDTQTCQTTLKISELVAELSMLDEAAAEVARLANAQTQPAGLAFKADSMGG